MQHRPAEERRDADSRQHRGKVRGQIHHRNVKRVEKLQRHSRQRRALPLYPLSVLLTGALGVAALTAVALQFFHPFDITVMDLAAHLAAVLVAVGIAALLGRPLLQRAPAPR